MPTPRGPNDPQRRERIVAATETVVAERGVSGLTHRAVAERAGVPLGSTTYYFATLEDLLHAALERAAQRYTTFLREWAAQYELVDQRGLAEALTNLVMRSLGPDQERNIMEYELYVAALRRPALRGLASMCTAASVEVLSAFTTQDKAAALTAALDGLMLQGLTAPTTPTREEVSVILTAIVDDS